MRALFLLAAGCGKPALTPATQIMVAITSDLAPVSQLSRLNIQLSKPDGSDLVTMRDFPLVVMDPKPGQQKLPMTFSVTKGHADTFLLVVSGYGPLGNDGVEGKVVEQRAIATFEDHKTLLLRIFLGGVCLHKLCGDTGQQVCTPVKVGANKAGDCIAVPMHSGADLTSLDPGMLPDFSLTPKGVEHADAGTGDAGANDAGANDAAGAVGTGGTGGMGGSGDPVAECVAASFQGGPTKACLTCLCSVSDGCRVATPACSGQCWGLLNCIKSNCPMRGYTACIVGMCSDFLKGTEAAEATAIMTTNMCFTTTCSAACAGGGTDGGTDGGP